MHIYIIQNRNKIDAKFALRLILGKINKSKKNIEDQMVWYLDRFFLLFVQNLWNKSIMLMNHLEKLNRCIMRGYAILFYTVFKMKQIFKNEKSPFVICLLNLLFLVYKG